MAVADNGVIGKDGAVPWYLPADLAHFKQTTIGHPIIMGRKTYESIGRALPGRTNIVITRNHNFHAEGCMVTSSINKTIRIAKSTDGSDEVFIIGGSEIYNLAMPLAKRIYLTKVHAAVDGDKFLIYDPSEWRQVSDEKHSSDAKNSYNYNFTIQERKKLNSYGLPILTC